MKMYKFETFVSVIEKSVGKKLYCIIIIPCEKENFVMKGGAKLFAIKLLYIK